MRLLRRDWLLFLAAPVFIAITACRGGGRPVDTIHDATEISGATTDAAATPQPSPTPEGPATIALRDARRVLDLAALRDALQRYYAREKSYPLAEGVQSVCNYPLDSACKLTYFLDPLPKDPQSQATYWYKSDGRTYTLYASMESAPPRSPCPSPVPEHLKDVPNLFCVLGSLKT